MGLVVHWLWPKIGGKIKSEVLGGTKPPWLANRNTQKPPENISLERW